jgi:hypothetical protein
MVMPAEDYYAAKLVRMDVGESGWPLLQGV